MFSLETGKLTIKNSERAYYYGIKYALYIYTVKFLHGYTRSLSKNYTGASGKAVGGI